MKYDKIEKGSVLAVRISGKTRSVKVLEANAQRDYTHKNRWYINLTCWCAEVGGLVSVKYVENQDGWLNVLERHFDKPISSSLECVRLGIGYPLHRDAYDTANVNGAVSVHEIATYEDISDLQRNAKKHWWQRWFENC